MHLIVGTTKLILERGDITQQDVDAIVNAANSGLTGGGGVDGAIHRAGGPEILAQCKAHVAMHGRLPAGEAMMTSGGRMKSRYVVHTVGPVWQGGNSREDELLANAYRNSLRVAVERNVETIAFPCISTGVYGFPPERAARIALQTVKHIVQELTRVREIRFVTYTQPDFEIYQRLFNANES